MIKITITKEQFEVAQNLYDFEKLNRSITNGGGNIYGAIGEVVVWDCYKDICEYVGDYNYDLIIGGQKVEVKSKKTSVEPEQHYLCSIADVKRKKNRKDQQECDWYCFVRVDKNLKYAWILGWMRKDEFFDKSEKANLYFEKGATDPTSDNDFTFKENCWNLPISELGEFE